MTLAPPARRAPWRGTLRGLAVGLGIGLLAAAAGQLIGFALFLAEGATGSYVPYLRIGAVYVELFHHIGLQLRTVPLGGGAPLSIAVGIGLLSILVVSVVLLWAAGRRMGSATRSGVAMVPAIALGYAIVPLLLAFVADADMRLPGALGGVASLEVRVSTWSAFIVPFAIACVALAMGVLSAPAAGTSAAFGDALVGDVVAGGVRAFTLGLLLSAAGVLVLAGVQPAVADAYAAVIGGPDSARGRIVAGGHAALLLPNQAIWVLVPALGGCDEIVVGERETPFLCYWRMPTGLSVDFEGHATPLSVSPGFRRPPRGYLTFLLVPVVATVAGGVRAARRAGSMRIAVLAGAASGLLFAGLVAAAIALARIDVGATGSLLDGSLVRLEAGPEFARGTLFAAAWGVVGGVVGGAATRYAATSESR